MVKKGGNTRLRNKLKNNQDVIFAHNEVLLSLEIDFLPGISIKNEVAHLNGHQVALFSRANDQDVPCPRWGCSFCRMGIIIPPFVVSSASAGLITTRSLIGRIENSAILSIFFT